MANNKRAKRTGSPRINRRVSSIVDNVAGILPYVLILAIIVIGLTVTANFVINSPFFKVKTIRIVGEKAGSDLGAIGTSLASKKGISIFNVDISSYKSAIGSKHPELKDIKVRRILPDTIEVYYLVRRPFCQIDSGRSYQASDDGVILPLYLSSGNDLPVVTGIDLPYDYIAANRQPSPKIKKAISLIKDFKKSDVSRIVDIKRLDIEDIKNPAIILRDDTRIEIGESSFKNKQGLLREVLLDLQAKGRSAKVIDLRFKDVIVTPRDKNNP